jgi:hypothetical protein
MYAVPAYYHVGSTVGFRNSMLRIPERSLTIIMLFNRTDVANDRTRRELVRIYSGE